LGDWAEAAGGCQLDDLRFACLARLARQLAANSRSLANSLAQASLLEHLDKSNLVLLLGMMTSSAGYEFGRPRFLPSAADLKQAASDAANPGRFEVVLELLAAAA